MKPGAHRCILVIALAIIGTQLVAGTPLHFANELRRIQCCARNCASEGSFTHASKCGCCKLYSSPSDVAASVAAKPLISAYAHAALPLPDLPQVQRQFVANAVWSTRIRAAPIYLETRSLRL